MAQPSTFGGYAKLRKYQYATLNARSFQYSSNPLYAPPPDPPPFEPPTDHPVEKDDDVISNSEVKDSPAEGFDSPVEEGIPSKETVLTSEAPEVVPGEEYPIDEPSTAEANCDCDPSVNPGDEVLGADEQTQDSCGGSADPDPLFDTTPIDPSDYDGNEDGHNGPKEADFPPIEPGEVEGDIKASEPVVNPPADEVGGDVPTTSPEAIPAVEIVPDTAAIEEKPPATAEPAEDKAGKKSKKSSKTKEKESKSKIKAKGKEKPKEAEKEKEKEKSKEKEKEKAKSSGKKKKGKAKVDSVAIPNDEPKSSPDESCPPDVPAVETQAEAVVDPLTETPIDLPTAKPAELPTETPVDPPTEAPGQLVVISESAQSDGATAEAEQGSVTEKPSVPEDVPEPDNEAANANDPQTKDFASQEALTAPEDVENLNDDPSAPVAKEAEPGETAKVEIPTPSDSSVAMQPSTEADENPAAMPAKNDEAVASDVPPDVHVINPPSLPSEVEIVEVIEDIATDPTMEASLAEVPNDSTLEPIQPEEEKTEMIEPLAKEEELKIEEQPNHIPEAAIAANAPTDEIDVTEAIPEAPRSEALDESVPELTQAGELQSEAQPNNAPPAETTERAPEDPPLESPSESVKEPVKTDDEKLDVVEHPDVKAEEQPIDVTKTEAAIVNTEVLEKVIVDPIQEQPAADEPPVEIVPAANDEKNDSAIEDPIQELPPIVIVAAAVDENNDKATEEPIQEQPAADESPIEIVAAAVDEKAVEAAPAEILAPVEQSAPVEEPSNPPGVEDTYTGEPVEQASTETAPSEPTLIEEPTAEPFAESVPVADAPPSPNSERHRRKRAAGWERQRRHSKASTPGSDLSGSITKTSPVPDKPPSESTTTRHKRHSSRRTVELDFAGKGTEHSKSERPKISRSSTSRRSHGKDRESEPAARPRILERVKTEADGRKQYRVNDTAPERPSRRRGEESFRREHRSDKHRDPERHREREREREKEREREREKEKEEAKAYEREKEKKRQEEDEERRERRRHRREEEEGKSKDGEGRETHHRHREHDKDRRRRGSSPPPAKKIGKSWVLSLIIGMGAYKDGDPADALTVSQEKLHLLQKSLVSPAGSQFALLSTSRHSFGLPFHFLYSFQPNKMPRPETSRLAIADIVFYTPALILSIIIVIRHGFKRQFGWIFLTVLALIRLIGNSEEIAANAQRSNGLFIAAAVLNALGLGTLLLAMIGMLKRVDQVVSQDRANPNRNSTITLKGGNIWVRSFMSGAEEWVTVILYLAAGLAAPRVARGEVQVAPTAEAHELKESEPAHEK
ncbi:MAG: hypothetical protein Q9226_003207 [Calogaya cf. arnoldii]